MPWDTYLLTMVQLVWVLTFGLKNNACHLDLIANPKFAINGLQMVTHRHWRNMQLIRDLAEILALPEVPCHFKFTGA